MEIANDKLALALTAEEQEVDIPRPVDKKIVDLARVDYLDDETLADLRNFGPASPRYKIYMAWRRRRAIRLAAQGFTYEEIAEMLGVSSQTVSKDIKAVRKLYEGTAKRDWVLLVEERLVTLDSDIASLRGAYDSLMGAGKIQHALQVFDRLDRLEKHRDKLLGIDKAAGAAYEPVRKKLIVNLSYESDQQRVIDVQGEPVALESGD